MKIIVADTSALVRLFVPDGPVPDDFENYIDAAWRGEIAVMVPEIALAEVVQVLWKKEKSGYLTAAEVDEIMKIFLLMPFEVEGQYDLLEPALSIARANNITVYDALFAALAKKHGAKMITADAYLKRVYNKIK
jgi:predicted nucleic acid-binding protein